MGDCVEGVGDKEINLGTLEREEKNEAVKKTDHRIQQVQGKIEDPLSSSVHKWSHNYQGQTLVLTNFSPPTSIQQVVDQLNAWEKQYPSESKFATGVIGEVHSLSSKQYPLISIEAWIYSIVHAFSDNLSLPAEYQKLSHQARQDFNVLTGFSSLSSLMGTHSFDVASAKKVVEAFVKGDAGLRNSYDKALVTAFYNNLEQGKSLEEAGEEAYQGIDPKNISIGMLWLIAGVSGYNPNHFTPYVPKNFQDVYDQLADWSRLNPSVTSFATAISHGLGSLEKKNTTLTFSEAWVYTLIHGITGNQNLPLEYQKLSSQEKQDFDTLTGYGDFSSKLSSNAFDLPTVMGIAEDFSLGDSGLRNHPDQALMTAFYTNLKAGQKLQEAAHNAYLTVSSSTVTPAMNVLLEGLSGYNPNQFTPHTPTSIQNLLQELQDWGTSDSAVKAFADAVSQQVKALNQAHWSLAGVEAWVIIALGDITDNGTFASEFQKLSSNEQGAFKVLSGFNDLSSKLQNSSFDPSEVEAIVKSLVDGTITFKNSSDTALIKDFSASLAGGEDPKSAAKDAYGKVDYKQVSATMNLLVEGLSGYTPGAFPSTPQALADAIVKYIGVNKNALITDLKTYVNSMEGTVAQDWKNFLVGFQPFIDSGALKEDKSGHYYYDSHTLLPSVVGLIESLVVSDQKAFVGSQEASIKGTLDGIASQVKVTQNFPYDEDLFMAKVKSLDFNGTQELFNEFYLKLDMGTPPDLSKIFVLNFPGDQPSPFAPKEAANPGMDALDPYIQINFSDEIPLFPRGEVQLKPSISSSEALPLSTWWQILGYAQAYNQRITVLDAGATPVANPPAMPIDMIQELYQKTPELFPTMGGSIEVQTPSSKKPFNGNILLKEGTLSSGDLVGPVVSQMVGPQQPAGDQGIYFVGNTGMGIIFSNPESYSVTADADGNWQGEVLTLKGGSEGLVEIRGASSPTFTNGPLRASGTVTPTGENSVVYQQTLKDGSTLTVPIVKNSPYMPLFTHETAPILSVGTPKASIAQISTFAYDNGAWKEMGSPIQSGATPTGQLFRFELKTTVGSEFYSVYTSAPQSFTLGCEVVKKIVPDSAKFGSGDEAQFIHYSDAAKLATLPDESEMHWFSATIRVPSAGGTPNQIVGSQSSGNQVTVISKVPAETASQLKDPMSESFGLPLDQGVGLIPIQSTVEEATMNQGQAVSETSYRFYAMTYPQAATTGYVGQFPNNYHNLQGAPENSEYSSGKLPYYQTYRGIQRMVPVTPQKNSDGTYSASLSYQDSVTYGLLQSGTGAPTVVTDWMDQADDTLLNGMVAALTNANLEPNPTVSNQDYSIGQETQTNANTALMAQKLLDLGEQGKVTLTADQKVTLQAVKATFLAAAEKTLGTFLGSISWDSKHNLMTSIYGDQLPAGVSGDFYNTIGQDLQFTNGYFIHAASSIRLLDPDYFETPDSTTPYVWDNPGSTPNQAQYRARIVDALVNEVEPRPSNAENSKMFPAGRQLDNDTHMFKSHGWNQPTLDGQDLESTAEAINYCQAAAVWNHLQSTEAKDPTTSKEYAADRDYHMSHSIEAVRAAQTFRLPANTTSVFQDPLSNSDLKDYGSKITFSNIEFVRKITSDTYWGPGPKGDILTPLGAACMQGINLPAPTLDAPTSEELVKTLFKQVYFDGNTPRETPDWSQITQSQLFTNEGWKDEKTRWGIATIIPTILPYIALYSPNLGMAILNWYNASNINQPSIYTWHLSCNYATASNYILEAQSFNKQQSAWTDPVSSTNEKNIVQYLSQMSQGTEPFQVREEKIKC